MTPHNNDGVRRRNVLKNLGAAGGIITFGAQFGGASSLDELRQNLENIKSQYETKSVDELWTLFHSNTERVRARLATVAPVKVSHDTNDEFQIGTSRLRSPTDNGGRSTSYQGPEMMFGIYDGTATARLLASTREQGYKFTVAAEPENDRSYVLIRDTESTQGTQETTAIERTADSITIADACYPNSGCRSIYARYPDQPNRWYHRECPMTCCPDNESCYWESCDAGSAPRCDQGDTCSYCEEYCGFGDYC